MVKSGPVEMRAIEWLCLLQSPSRHVQIGKDVKQTERKLSKATALLLSHLPTDAEQSKALARWELGLYINKAW